MRSLVEMPRGARIVDARILGSTPHVWAIVEDGAPLVARRIGIYFNDDPLAKDCGAYIAAFYAGDVVVHAFDGGEVCLATTSAEIGPAWRCDLPAGHAGSHYNDCRGISWAAVLDEADPEVV